MKRIVLGLMVLAAAISPLVAGGSSEARTAEGKEQVITLKISHNMDFTTIPEAVVDAGARLNEKYKAEGKNIRIEFEKDYQTIDWTQYQNNIVFAHKTGDQPDFYAISDVASLVKNGLLLDLTDLVEETKDLWVPGVFTTATDTNGRVYAFPPDLPVRAIYYNRDCLKAIGWTDEEVNALPGKVQEGSFTFEDYIALCKEVVDKGGAKEGLIHRTGAGNDFLDMIVVLGGQYYDEKGTLVFDREGLKRFFQLTYDDSNVREITPHNLNQQVWTEVEKRIYTGDAFSYYGPVYASPYMASAAGVTISEFAEKVGFIMFPKSQYVDHPFVYGAPQYVGISSKTKYPDLCKELYKMLVTEDTDLMARHAATINTLSSVKAANEDPQMAENPIVAATGYMAQYALVAPSIDGLSTYRSELFKQIVALELGQTTPEKAVSDMETQITLNVKNVIVK